MKQQFSFHNVFWGVVIGMASIYLYGNITQTLYPQSSVLGINTSAVGVPVTRPPIAAPTVVVMPPTATASVPCTAAKDLVTKYCSGTLPPGSTTPSIPTPYLMSPTPAGGKGLVFNLSAQGTFKGAGSGSAMITKLTNDYYSFTVNANFSALIPGRTYQLWLCGADGNCSSNANGATFKTDSNGSGKISNVVITSNQTNNAVRYAKVWQTGAAASGDASACPKTSNSATPCIQGIFSM